MFLTRGFVDSFYQARRDNVTLIGNACYAPGVNCFCEAMGVAMTEPETDIILRDAGDEGYIWEVKTEPGEKLTQAVAEFLSDKELKAPEAKAFQTQVDYAGVAEKLKGMFDDPIWERMSQPCVNCRACTYICPSCHCFDIQVKMWEIRATASVAGTPACMPSIPLRPEEAIRVPPGWSASATAFAPAVLQRALRVRLMHRLRALHHSVPDRGEDNRYN